MIDRFAYVWLVLGEGFDEDLAVDTLTKLWVRALGIPGTGPADWSGPAPARTAGAGRQPPPDP
jgi:hypothetical protein